MRSHVLPWGMVILAEEPSPQVGDAMAVARRPAGIDNRNRTSSRAGKRVVARKPRMARSWVGLTIVACLPGIVAPR